MSKKKQVSESAAVKTKKATFRKFSIVGIGASAGGLEALESFLPYAI